MAMYITREEFKTWLQDQGAANDFTIDQVILAASRAIDQFTGRSFTAEAAATKYVIARDTCRLDLPRDIRTITSVAVDSNGDGTFPRTMTEDTDFLRMPLVPLDSGVYQWLETTPTTSKSWSVGHRVRIVADWGYVVSGRAPDDVRQACLIQASRYYARRTSPLGILQSVDLGTYSRISKIDPDMEAILTPYKVATQAWVVV